MTRQEAAEYFLKGLKILNVMEEKGYDNLAGDIADPNDNYLDEVQVSLFWDAAAMLFKELYPNVIYRNSEQAALSIVIDGKKVTELKTLAKGILRGGVHE